MRIILSLVILFTVTACHNTVGAGNKSTVYFGFGSSALDGASKATIDKAAQAAQLGQNFAAPWKHDNCHTKFAISCKSTGSSRVSLVGHTDTVGSPKANQRLSEARVDAVKTRLIAKGVSANAISTSAKSEGSPAVDSGDEVKESKNRRVEIYVH